MPKGFFKRKVTANRATKTCPKCGTIKKRDGFYEAKSRTDGLRSWCSECVKVAAKEYSHLHKEIYRKRAKKYKELHREAYRDHQHKRQALKYQTQSEPINEKVVYLRDGWICQHCKKRVDKRLKHPNPMCASLDHIIPLTKGGSHTYDNVQLAHLQCNVNKHTNILPQGEQLRIF